MSGKGGRIEKREKNTKKIKMENEPDGNKTGK